MSSTFYKCLFESMHLFSKLYNTAKSVFKWWKWNMLLIVLRHVLSIAAHSLRMKRNGPICQHHNKSYLQRFFCVSQKVNCLIGKIFACTYNFTFYVFLLFWRLFIFFIVLFFRLLRTLIQKVITTHSVDNQLWSLV